MIIKRLNFIFNVSLLLCLLCLLPGHDAQALVRLQDDTDIVAIAPEILYFEDQTGSQSFFQAQSQFKRFERDAAPHDSMAIHLSSKGSVYWLKVTIDNSTDQQNWVLHFQPLQDMSTKPVWIDEITVYQNDATGKPIHTTKENYIPLSLSAQHSNDFLIMVKTINGLNASFRPVLETEQRFAAYQRSEISKVTFSWILISIFATAALIFFILSRLPAFLIFAVYCLVFIEGVMLTVDFSRKFYILLSNIASPIQIMPFVATLMSMGAVLLTSFSIKDKALPFLLKFLLVALVGVMIGIFFFTDTLMTLPVSVEVVAKSILLITGIVLAVTALSQSFQDSKNLWLLPAWLIFGVQGFIIVLSPLVLPLMHLSFLGFAMILQVYTLWQDQERVRHEQQQKLQNDMNQMRQHHEKENFMWERKLESERGLLNNAKQREALRSTQLAEAKSQADAANKAKSDFLAMISHEIRTPMTGIMGMVHLTAHTHLDEKQQEYIDTIQNAGETLLTLLNDVLDYSKLEKGAIIVERIPFGLRAMVQSVVTLMSGRANEKSLRLLTHIDDDIPDRLMGDPNRIRQVLINLLSNAIKFTDKGSVTVEVLQDKSAQNYNPDHILLKVKIVDTGIGISKEAQDKLFSAYNQADASIARRFGGTGLGLNICRMLVQAMGGDVHVHSVLGQGSTFWFTLTLTEASYEMQLEGHEDIENITIPPLNVLVVDDNPVNLKVIAGLLELDNHKVKTVESGTKALNEIEQTVFDLVFMDIQMPGFDGLTITRAIRKLNDARRANMPIYALTGMGRDEDEEACKAAGMNGVLVKPIRVPAFKRILISVSNAKNMKSDPSDVSETTMNLKDLAQKAKTVVDDTKKAYGEIKNHIRQGLASDQVPAQEMGISLQETEVTRSPLEDPTALLDIAMLDDLRKSLPPESFTEIFSDLDQKADELVLGIETGWNAKDKDDVSEKAHNLRGMAGNFGLNLLSLVAERIEKAVKIGLDDVVATEVARIRGVLMRTQDELRNWHARN